jgi:hypothetical protein
MRVFRFEWVEIFKRERGRTDDIKGKIDTGLIKRKDLARPRMTIQDIREALYPIQYSWQERDELLRRETRVKSLPEPFPFASLCIINSRHILHGNDTRCTCAERILRPPISGSKFARTAPLGKLYGNAFELREICSATSWLQTTQME